MKFKHAQVYAYDLKPDYGLTIDELARLNNVESRINYFIAKVNYTFKELVHDDCSLVICDCEGCEMEIFSSMNQDKLINTVLIIETPDFLKKDCTNYLIDLFQNTHKIKVYHLIPKDIKLEKLRVKFQEISDMALDLCAEEGRSISSGWIFFESLLNN